MKDHSMPTVSLVKLTQALVFVLLLVVAQYGTTVSAQSASISNANAFEQEPVQEHRMVKLTRPERCATCDSHGVQVGEAAKKLKTAQDLLADANKEKKDLKDAYDKQKKVRDAAKTAFDAARAAYENAKKALKDYKDKNSKKLGILKKELNNLRRALQRKKNQDDLRLRLVANHCARVCARNPGSKECTDCKANLDAYKKQLEREQKKKQTEIDNKKKEIDAIVDKYEELRDDMDDKNPDKNPDVKKVVDDYWKAEKDLKKLADDCKKKEKEVKNLRKALAHAENVHDHWVAVFARCQGRKC